MVEEWRDIPGYEGIYQVSNIGRVKTLAKSYRFCQSSIRRVPERLLKTQKHSDGYVGIELSNAGISKRYPVHRLVAMAFIPNPDNKPFIDHIDTVRDNNNVNNLRWVTTRENSANPLTREKCLNVVHPMGEDSPLFEGKSPDAKAVLQFSKDGVFIARYDCVHQAARRNGYNFSNIARACRGERFTYKKYVWKYE